MKSPYDVSAYDISFYNYKWQREENRVSTPVRIKEKSYDYDSTQVTSQEIVRYEGRFQIEINLNEITAAMVRRAAFAKSGKSSTFHGTIKCKRLTKKEISRDKKTYPLADNATLREPKEHEK